MIRTNFEAVEEDIGGSWPILDLVARLPRTPRFWLTLLSWPVLSSCTVVADIQTYDAVATDRYSNWEESTLVTKARSLGCRWPCYSIGDSQISFFPATRGSNVIAMGPLLPIIPAPGSGKSHGEFDFFLAIHVHPGPVSLVIFKPNEFRIHPNGSDHALAPSLVSDCEDGTESPAVVRVYGDVQCFKLDFPVPRSNLEDFILVPAIIESDGDTYVLPDFQWTPGTYRIVE